MTKYPFGTDYKLVLDEDGQFDVDTTFAIETDPAKIVVWDMLKTITTGQGVLWWAPTSTEDLNESLNDGFTAPRLAQLQGRLKGVIETDPRLTFVSVVASLRGRELLIKIEATAADSAISLVLVRKEDGTIAIEEVNGTF